MEVPILIAESKSARKQIRQQINDPYNRLHSIAEDATFVAHLGATYPQFKIYPNLRCGAWYVDPDISGKMPVYFKSTDGHFGQWNFNLRRSNLHLLQSISEHGGIILVDSTRQGKKIPDALSKTVPIWCSVINLAIVKKFQSEITWNIGTGSLLYTPPGSVSRSEHSQIETHLEEWASHLLSSEFSLSPLRKPLRPIWITPDTSILPLLDNVDFYPIICVSASRLVEEGHERRNAGFTYVQGSGDDHESWSQGLTPALYWGHKERLLSHSRSELLNSISTLVATTRYSTGEQDLIPILKSGCRLYLGTVDCIRTNNPPDELSQLIITSDTSFNLTPAGDHILLLWLPAGKKGQLQFLTNVLPKSLSFLNKELNSNNKVAILCDDGKDVSVGVAVATLALYFGDDGNFFDSTKVRVTHTKASINKRLQWILTNNSRANPSRTTLKRVNEYLMSQPRHINTPSSTVQ